MIVRCDCAGKSGVDAAVTTEFLFGKTSRPSHWSRRARRAVTATAAAVVSSLALVGCATGTDAVATGETFNFVSPGGEIEIHYDPPADRQKIAPMSGPEVIDPEVSVAVADFPGQVVLINLWGQWCGPCRAEIDDLQRLQEKYQSQGFTNLGVNLRDPNRQKPVDFIKDNGVTYPSIWDPSQAAVAALQGFPTSVVPATLILDKQHRVAAVYLAEVTDTQLEPVIERLLAEPNKGDAA